MKLSLPLKLGIFVVLLFAVTLATCMLWTPVRVWYYMGKYHSGSVQRCASGISGLFSLGEKGNNTLISLVGDELKCASDKRRILLIDSLLSIDEVGIDILSEILDGGRNAALFLTEHWNKANEHTHDPERGIGGGELIGFNSLGISAYKGYQLVSELLIAKGADLNAKDFDELTPLIYVLDKKDWVISKLLIEKGADLSIVTSNGESPLHIAVKGGNEDIVSLIIRYGAKIDARDKNGNTPLYAAVKNGNIKMIDLLIRGGTDINNKNMEGQYPLQQAITYGHIEVVDFLIRNGADINVKLSWDVFSNFKLFETIEGSFLHLASERGSGEIVMLLIDAGLDINALDNKEYTPLDIAINEENKEIASLLRSHGGKTGEELSLEHSNKQK